MVATALLASSAASAQAKILRRDIKEFVNVCGPDSPTKRDCNVKKVVFEVRDFAVADGRYPIVGTLAYSGFEANSWADAGQYGFVQTIRGCSFESKRNPDGTISRRIGKVLKHLGEWRTQSFPDWSFDANTFDPIYFGPYDPDSKLPGGRLTFYHWTNDFALMSNPSGRPRPQYGEILGLKPAAREKLRPILYVIDTPVPAAYSKATKSFDNVALDFRICLYHLKDIPAAVKDETPLSATPIVCNDWESKVEFDFDRNEFVRPLGQGEHAFCATQQPEWPQDALLRELKAAGKLPPGN